MLKVLALTNIPSPYRVNFFNELGKYCRLTVMFEKSFSAERDEDWKNFKAENFTPVMLKGLSTRVNKAFCPNVVAKVKNTDFDIMFICGYNTPTAMYLIDYLRRHNKPFLLNADGGVIKKDKALVEKIKRHYISAASAWLTTSDITVDYFAHYGADRKKIYKYPFTSVYEKDVLPEPVSEGEKNRLRAQLGLKEKKTVLSVGQFIHRKGFDVLLRAACDCRGYQFVIVGGVPTEEYRSIVSENGLDNIVFLPFMPPSELARYYKASDLFVLPTREDIWGLVINEAAAYALPIVSTDTCVAGTEIIGACGNGIIVEKDNEKALSEAIGSILSRPDVYNELSLKSLAAARMYTLEQMAAKHIEIFEREKADGK